VATILGTETGIAFEEVSGPLSTELLQLINKKNNALSKIPMACFIKQK
jgi:hypothetical protein